MRKALRLSAGRAAVNLTSEQCSPVCSGRMEAATSCTSLGAVAKKLALIERERYIYIYMYIYICRHIYAVRLNRSLSRACDAVTRNCICPAFQPREPYVTFVLQCHQAFNDQKRKRDCLRASCTHSLQISYYIIANVTIVRSRVVSRSIITLASACDIRAGDCRDK